MQLRRIFNFDFLWHFVSLLTSLLCNQSPINVLKYKISWQVRTLAQEDLLSRQGSELNLRAGGLWVFDGEDWKLWKSFLCCGWKSLNYNMGCLINGATCLCANIYHFMFINSYITVTVKRKGWWMLRNVIFSHGS